MLILIVEATAHDGLFSISQVNFFTISFQLLIMNLMNSCMNKKGHNPDMIVRAVGFHVLLLMTVPIILEVFLYHELLVAR